MEKNPRYQLISSRDIDDQRILQSDWMRETNGALSIKILRSYLFLRVISMQKIQLNPSKDIKTIKKYCSLIG